MNREDAIGALIRGVYGAVSCALILAASALAVGMFVAIAAFACVRLYAGLTG